MDINSLFLIVTSILTAFSAHSTQSPILNSKILSDNTKLPISSITPPDQFTEPTLIDLQTIHITGNRAADSRIFSIANERGYHIQQTPPTDMIETDRQFLQPEATNSWVSLKNDAARSHISLGLISGYRSIDTQQTLFKQRFDAASIATIGRIFSVDEVISGSADSTINFVMSGTAPPGYSKHHTGYTIDITDINSRKPFTAFGETAGYEWISNNDFEMARKHGFIPSYPVGNEKQGPEPEAWEFVWVGQLLASRTHLVPKGQ